MQLQINRFGEKLRKLRKQHQLTLTELGDQLAVHNTFISQMETGRKMPNAVMLLKISKFFKVSVDQLIDDTLEVD